MYHSNFTAPGTALERTSDLAKVAKLADLEVRTVATSSSYPSLGCFMWPDGGDWLGRWSMRRATERNGSHRSGLRSCSSAASLALGGNRNASSMEFGGWGWGRGDAAMALQA